MKKNSALVITQILIKAAFSDISKENKNTTLGQVAAILRRVNHKHAIALLATAGHQLGQWGQLQNNLLCVCVTNPFWLHVLIVSPVLQ